MTAPLRGTVGHLDGHDRRAFALPEDAVGVVRDVGGAPCGVGGRGVDRVQCLAVEEELPREGLGAAQVHLHVDVHGAARVPAREDRPERGGAVRIRHLNAAEEGARVALDTRVLTACVAVPEVDRRVLDRLAGVGVEDDDAQVERHALATLGDVPPDEIEVEVVRALCELGREDTVRAVPPGSRRRRRPGPAAVVPASPPPSPVQPASTAVNPAPPASARNRRRETVSSNPPRPTSTPC